MQLAGENGFDLLGIVPITFKLFFVTAYDEYAIRAFEVNATDYLLKPVDPETMEGTAPAKSFHQDREIFKPLPSDLHD